MNVGFMGMGKLGLPVALAIEKKGHKVIGYDPSPQVQETIMTKELPYKEAQAKEWLKKSNIQHKSIRQVVEHSDIYLCAIQTHMVKSLKVQQEYLMKEKISIIVI